MIPLLSIAALALVGCGILDRVEEVVDPPPKVIQQDHVIDLDSAAVDTLGEPRPPSPPGGDPEVTFGNGGAK
jgi:hypothetical protein